MLNINSFEEDIVFFHKMNEANGYLSNWFMSEFVLDDNKFCCVEQYMMWRKAITFNDLCTADKIIKESDPVIIKRLGREVLNYKDSVWSAMRYSVVHDGLYAKFTQNSELKDMLLNSSGVFAECAPNDLIWGIGISLDDPRRFNKDEWRGKNLLGIALQQIYEEIKG